MQVSIHDIVLFYNSVISKLMHSRLTSFSSSTSLDGLADMCLKTLSKDKGPGLGNALNGTVNFLSLMFRISCDK